MSANLIIFDGYYTADQMRNLDAARNLVQEALNTLKQASLHEGWKCPESRNIDNALDTIKSKVGGVEQGIVRTAIALGTGLKAFTELEERAANQANTLSSDLKSKHGFIASNYGQGESTTVDVTQVPHIDLDYDIGCYLPGAPKPSFRDAFDNIIPAILDNDDLGDTPEDAAPLLKHLEKSLGAAWTLVSTALSNGAAKIPGLFDKLKSTVSDFIDDLGQLDGVSKEEFNEKLFELVGNTFENVGGVGEQLGDAIVYSVTEGIKEWFGEFGIDTSPFFDVVQDGWERGKQLVEDCAKGIERWFNSLMPWGK